MKAVIKVEEETRERLKNAGTKRETYDDVITYTLDLVSYLGFQYEREHGELPTQSELNNLKAEYAALNEKPHKARSFQRKSYKPKVILEGEGMYFDTEKEAIDSDEMLRSGKWLITIATPLAVPSEKNANYHIIDGLNDGCGYKLKDGREIRLIDESRYAQVKRKAADDVKAASLRQ